MGLGKTIQTISLLTYLVEVKRINGPFLVIVPLSTLTNWNLEFDKWAPAVKKITYKGTPNQRKVLQQDIRTGNFQVLLTTFEYIIKDKALLSRIKWVHMIIDEGHRMKNSNSKLSETLTHNYHSDYRLILTGTPLQNNLPELWALLNFVLPKIFNSVKSFDEWFNTPFANTGGQDKIELTEEETLLVIRRLHKVLRPFLLRRLKKDVEKDLPNKVEKVVKCKMSSLQSKLYQQMLRYNILYASDPSDGATPLIIKNANNQIMQLRKICNHPFVYEEVENLINPAVENNDQIWRVAGKFELLDKVLPKFKATGHRVLIFFQMTQIMDIMEDFLRYRNLKYMRLDGGTKADDRTGLLKLFNAPDSEYFCFLLSTRAGGLGLNLQTADTVIIFDTDWNPHQDLQAQDRAHRIGQKNEVRILRLITEDSVEEMILERAHAKLEIDGKVIQAGKFDQKSTSEEQEAMLRALFEKEDERRSKGSTDEEDDMDDDELNQVIARNDNELTVFRKMDEDRIIATRNAPYPSRLYSDQELPEVYKKDPADVIKKDEIKVDEYGRGSRERKVMKYDDNLSEEQWLKKIDGLVSGDESDSDVELRPKRNKGRPRAKRATDINSEISSKADSPSEYGEGKRSYSDYLGGDSPDAGSTSKRQRANTPRGGSKGRNNAKGRGAGRGRGNLAYRATPTVDPLTSEERSKLQSILENILDCILDYRNDEGRVLSDIFMVKPPKRLYPDYYVLIKHPIALDTIKKRISGKIYVTERELLEDIHLMFSNARIYNEEGSVVYEDAKTLEHLAINKFKELTELPSEAVEKTLDFREFDETFSLKPLVVGIAVKHPVEEPKLDMDAFDLPDFPLDLETGDSTPAAFE
jgi:ATP-dependent helicase STH1/SNF2